MWTWKLSQYLLEGQGQESSAAKPSFLKRGWVPGFSTLCCFFWYINFSTWRSTGFCSPNFLLCMWLFFSMAFSLSKNLKPLKCMSGEKAEGWSDFSPSALPPFPAVSPHVFVFSFLKEDRLWIADWIFWFLPLLRNKKTNKQKTQNYPVRKS